MLAPAGMPAGAIGAYFISSTYCDRGNYGLFSPVVCGGASAALAAPPAPGHADAASVLGAAETNDASREGPRWKKKRQLARCVSIRPRVVSDACERRTRRYATMALQWRRAEIHSFGLTRERVSCFYFFLKN